MMPGNAPATAAPEGGANEPDEMAILNEIKALLVEIKGALKGSDEVVKEGQAGAGLENEDKKAKPVESKTAGKPLTDIKSQVETDKIINKDVLALQKEFAELKKSLAVDSKAVDAIRAPADVGSEALASDSLELRKQAIHKIANGEDKRSVYRIAKETLGVK